MKYLLFLISLLFLGCAKPVIRDATVYRAEIDFIDAASLEIIDRAKAVLDVECVCVEIIEGVVVFERAECAQLAETVLVMEARMKYHTDFMRFLGGLSENRPDKTPGEVKDINTLCKGKK